MTAPPTAPAAARAAPNAAPCRQLKLVPAPALAAATPASRLLVLLLKLLLPLLLPLLLLPVTPNEAADAFCSGRGRCVGARSASACD
jgi:hypothetical protein